MTTRAAPLPQPELLADFLPMAQRAVDIDQASLIRFRAAADAVSGFVKLPYDVLAGRTVAALGVADFDLTVPALEFARWLADPSSVPSRADAGWLGPLPPRSGWERVDVVPEEAIREVVRSGAVLAPSATSRSGQQALLSAIVLTARSASRTVEVPLGPLTALTRMGFLPRDSQAAVDVARGWIRVAAPFGSSFVSDGNPLGLLSL